jgi:hypothetical protein
MRARIASGIGAIAVLMLLIATACDNNGTQPAPTATVGPATPTPLATATPTATVAPQAIGGIEVIPLQIGEEAELPPNVALIIEAAGDGPTNALYRVYRDVSGEVRTDELATGETLGLPPRTVSTPGYIHSLALNSDASEIVVDVCTHGHCVYIDEASPDAQSTLYRSTDGGVTWEEFGVLDGSYYVEALAKEGLLLSGPWGPEHQWKRMYELFPSREPVEPPPGAGEERPVSLPDGDLAWLTEDGRLLRSDGSELLALGEGAFVVAYRWRKIDLDPSGSRLALTYRAGGRSAQDYLGVFSIDRRFSTLFSVPAFAMVGGWVNSNLLVGNAAISAEDLGTPPPETFVGYLPVLFDLDARLVRPIPHPFLDAFFGNRHHVQAVLLGPFARVVNTRACLSVRQEPGMATAVLACAADGVLLKDTGETREVDGTTWRRVVTPAGVEGWASSQYLER